jgi:hypothetical protein
MYEALSYSVGDGVLIATCAHVACSSQLRVTLDSQHASAYVSLRQHTSACVVTMGSEHASSTSKTFKAVFSGIVLKG